jgi:hypothetical protein
MPDTRFSPTDARGLCLNGTPLVRRVYKAANSQPLPQVPLCPATDH